MFISFRSMTAALAITAVVAAGCKKKDATPAADTTAMMPPAAAPVQVTAVDIGKSIGSDMRVAAPLSDLGTRDTVYASVVTSGSGDATLVARWTFQDGQVVDSTSRSIAPTGDAVTEFHIMKPSRWPAGKYTVEIFLNGQSVQKKDFNIK